MTIPFPTYEDVPLRHEIALHGLPMKRCGCGHWGRFRGTQCNLCRYRNADAATREHKKAAARARAARRRQEARHA